MLIWFVNKYSKLKPVVIDGALYVSIAIFGSLTGIFGSDETFKYVNVYVCWWVKSISEIGLAGASALKMFRSTSYSDHLASTNGSNPDGTSKAEKSPSTTQQTNTNDNPKIQQVGL